MRPSTAWLTLLGAALLSVAAATMAAPSQPDAAAAPPLPPGVAAPAPPPAPPSANVKIVFTVQPSTRKAMVFSSSTACLAQACVVAKTDTAIQKRTTSRATSVIAGFRLELICPGFGIPLTAKQRTPMPRRPRYKCPC